MQENNGYVNPAAVGHDYGEQEIPHRIRCREYSGRVDAMPTEHKGRALAKDITVDSQGNLYISAGTSLDYDMIGINHSQTVVIYKKGDQYYLDATLAVMGSHHLFRRVKTEPSGYYIRLNAGPDNTESDTMHAALFPRGIARIKSLYRRFLVESEPEFTPQ